MQGCAVLVKTLLCLQATETHKDAQLLPSSVMSVHLAREAAGRDNLHDVQREFLAAATLLAGCLEPTATRLPWPRLAAATLGGMVEW